jgi:hypothetical protein
MREAIEKPGTRERAVHEQRLTGPAAPGAPRPRPRNRTARFGGLGRAVPCAFLLLAAEPSLFAAQTAPEFEGVRFSAGRGFYSAPFDLELAPTAPGATIRFTLDGSTPSPAAGLVYTAPIRISKTTVVRAMSHQSGTNPSAVGTHTYLFVADVLRQPWSVPGYPHPTFESVTLDYEMDPDIVNDAAYRDRIAAGFTAIPSLCLATGVSEFFSVYNTTSDDVRVPCSIEYFDPADPAKGSQATGWLKPHSWSIAMRSLRVTFSREVGPAKWRSDVFRDAPLGAATASSIHNGLVVRIGANRNPTTRWNPDKNAISREPWIQMSQVRMSGYGLHTTHCHVWVNGLYWGVYKPTERPESGYMQEYFGGLREDYFTLNHGGPKDGDPARWNYLTGALKDKDMTVPANYEELRQHLDVAAFCDYLILNWFAGTSDWPENNWWGAMRLSPPGPMRFFCWDADDCWDGHASAGPGWPTSGGRGSDGAWVPPAFRPGGSNSAISNLWHSARRNPDFMTLFADRIYKHCFHGGALTDANNRARWKTLTDYVRPATVPDAARWGDARAPLGEPTVPPGDRFLGITRHPDAQFEAEVPRVDGRMNGNVARMISACRGSGYYPGVDPPQFTPHGGTVAGGFQLTLANPNAAGGDIYYTLDGTDPRASGGGVAASAQKYSSAVTLGGVVPVKTRFRAAGGPWSALSEAVFVAGSVPSYANLRITEIMYHAPDQGTVNGDDYDFVEIKNVGPAAISLTGVSLSGGVWFEFPYGGSIPPGGFAVVASNAARFREKYGIDPQGAFQQSLSNSGETVELRDPLGGLILSVRYSDEAPWPLPPDGQGYSLVPADPQAAGDPNAAAFWRSSANPGGSPGKDDVGSPGGGPPPPPAVTVTFQDGANGYAGTRDTYLSETNPSANDGSAASLRVDGDEAGGTDLAALLRFDLSSIPAGSTVESATLTVNVTNPSAQSYAIYALLRDWNELEANWTMADAASAWERPGAQGAGDRGATAIGAVSAGATGTHRLTLGTAGLAALKGWIDSPATNYGFLIGDSANGDGLAFDSREAAAPANRPSLTITYRQGQGGVLPGGGSGGGGKGGGCGATGWEGLLLAILVALHRRRVGRSRKLHPADPHDRPRGRVLTD